MWVSRERWDYLLYRVRELEQTPPVFYVFADGCDGPSTRISYEDAIKALAAHIGCEFKYQKGTTTKAVLVKKAK